MKGFTLIEMLVASLIMGVITVALSVVMSLGQRSFFTGDVAIGLREQTIRAVMAMDKEISKTRPSRTNLTIGASSNTITFSVPQDNNADGSIVDSMGNIEWSSSITYALNGERQIIRSQAGVNSVIGIDIEALQFTRTEDRIMQVDISAQNTPRLGQEIQDNEQVIIKMRN
jgi:prepilin-type N-terminal cleavage/methylation domain-containing protein